MKGTEAIVKFLVIIICISWVSRETGIIKDQYRQESIHWAACQCKTKYKEQIFWLRAPELREEIALNKILDAFDLKKDDYVLCSATAIDSAAAYATIKDGRNYIIYDHSYFETITDARSTWIIGHEVGHHVHAHTKTSNYTNPYANEDEADEFAGEAMFKLDYSLSEALYTLDPDYPGDDCHSPGHVRQASTEKGWKRAEQGKISTPRYVHRYRMKEDNQMQALDAVRRFILALGTQNFRQAFRLQKIRSWGSYEFFSSDRAFGGIVDAAIISAPEVLHYHALASDGKAQIKVKVRYLAVDPVNDKCDAGIIYDQLFWVEGQGDHWQIAKARMNKTQCQ